MPFGCYRREVFTRNGLFDEDHVRTEDDEFNLRLRKNGGRSLLVPEIIIDYYARESLPKIWRMYYYYGYFKPLVARKLGLVLGLRHLIPSLLVLTLALSSAFGLVVSELWECWGSWSCRLIFWQTWALPGWLGGGKAWAVIACLTLVFPTLHFSYGLGFLKGLLDFFLLGKKGVKDSERGASVTLRGCR